MKKYYFFAALAVIGMVCSCNKDPKNNGGKEGEEETASFKVDGSFDDWKGSSIATADLSGIEETSYENLHVMKAAADSKKVYFYFEYELEDGQTIAPIDILINSDGDASTGFTSWIWSKEGCGWDFMLESENGFLGAGNTITDLSDMAVYKFVEGNGQDAWDPGSKFEQQNVDDFIECKGSVKGGIAYFEMSILRSVINANKAGKLAFGVTMTDATTGDWVTKGILPQSEEGIGSGDLLEVKLP